VLSFPSGGWLGSDKLRAVRCNQGTRRATRSSFPSHLQLWLPPTYSFPFSLQCYGYHFILPSRPPPLCNSHHYLHFHTLHQRLFHTLLISNMVHLASVPTDKDVAASTEGLKNIKLQEPDDTFAATVYGSRYAACDLPKVEMPESEMPKEVAYRMIK
jgi:hypothetical protein